MVDLFEGSAYGTKEEDDALSETVGWGISRDGVVGDPNAGSKRRSPGTTESAQVQLTQSRGSGVSGTATLKAVEGGVKVTLNMQSLPQPGVRHINHIHAGGT